MDALPARPGAATPADAAQVTAQLPSAAGLRFWPPLGIRPAVFKGKAELSKEPFLEK